MVEMNFNKKEKLAIFRILEDIAKADQSLQTEEMNYLIRVANNFNWNNKDIQQTKSMTLKDAGDTLMKMDIDKKLIFKQMIIHIADSDGNIHNSEFVAVLDTFFMVK